MRAKAICHKGDRACCNPYAGGAALESIHGGRQLPPPFYLVQEVSFIKKGLAPLPVQLMDYFFCQGGVALAAALGAAAVTAAIGIAPPEIALNAFTSLLSPY